MVIGFCFIFSRHRTAGIGEFRNRVCSRSHTVHCGRTILWGVKMSCRLSEFDSRGKMLGLFPYKENLRDLL